MTPLANIDLTKEDFRSCHWQQVIDSIDKKECWHYSHALFAKASESEKSGDKKAEQLYTFLAVVTNLHLNLDAPNDVFIDLQFSFSPQQLDLLHDLIPEIDDPELRARISDIVWTFKRPCISDIRETVILAYLKSATRVEDGENWVGCERNIERALQVALNSNLFPVVIQHIEEVLGRMDGQDPLFLSLRLMQLLYKHGAGDPVKYAVLSEKLALCAASTSTWYVSRDYWDIAADWHKRSKNQASRRSALLASAETYVKEATEALSRAITPYMLASSHLGHAIQMLGKIPGTKERIDELHKLLLEYQQKSLAEMTPISGDTIDVMKIVEQATQSVKGKSPRDALFALALLGKPVTVASMRKVAEDLAKESVISSLFPVRIMNSMGRTIAREPVVNSSNPEEALKQKEQKLLGKMLQNASLGWNLHVQACIEPAKYQVNSEHNIRLRDFLDIVSNSPFVPNGRELLYAKGLSAGMSGNFLESTHLLVPQIEHSMRYVLAQRGITTTTMDKEGIQTELDLNKILKTSQYNEPLMDVFGEDLLFNLRGLLVERFGANLRNDMAHGLLDANQFYSAPSCYLWWLVLRICCLFVLSIQNQS